MLVVMRDRMRKEIAAKHTIDQVLASKITAEYDKDWPNGRERFLPNTFPGALRQIERLEPTTHRAVGSSSVLSVEQPWDATVVGVILPPSLPAHSDEERDMPTEARERELLALKKRFWDR